MATRRWLGVVTAVKQINTITVGGTIVIGDVFTVVCGYGTVTVVAADTVAANVAILLQAALAATTATPEFAEITWTVVSAVVTGTAKTAGVPFVVTSSATASATCVSATTKACTGPNYANVAANWSDSTLPTTGDTALVEIGAPDILYGLTSNTDLLAKLTITAGYRGKIGLQEINPAGYREYRSQYLSMNLTALEVGVGNGSGSNLIKIDLKATATALLVLATGASTNSSERALQLIGGTGATLVAIGGIIGIATRLTEAAAFTSIKTGGTADISSGATCTTMTVLSGVCYSTGQVTNLDVSGGICVYVSPATLTSAYVGPGTLNCSDIRSRTITALRMRKLGSFIDQLKTCTITALTLETGVTGMSAS